MNKSIRFLKKSYWTQTFEWYCSWKQMRLFAFLSFDTIEQYIVIIPVLQSQTN